MKIVWCGGLFLWVFLASEISARDYRRSNEGDAKILTVAARADREERLVDWKFENSNSQPGEETFRRKPRCYDEETEARQEPAVTQSAGKLPAWAGTLYHHKILHPYHDWSNAGIIADPWNHDTRF